MENTEVPVQIQNNPRSVDIDLLAEIRKLTHGLADVRREMNARLDAMPMPGAPVKIERDKARLFLPTDWPRAGGRGFSPAPTTAFTGEAYRDTYRPGVTRGIYIAACAGLSQLSRRLHIPLYKPGTCGSDDLWRRMRQLRIDRYGAARRQGESYVAEAGWDSWFPSHVSSRSLPSAASPITVRERHIEVVLPQGMEPEAFDEALDREIKAAALDLWVMTDAGRGHCATLRVDPAEAQRLTLYPGGEGRLSPASEICVISPSISGPDRLSALSERIILRHLAIAS